jgi:hydroxypyruvate isomerase
MMFNEVEFPDRFGKAAAAGFKAVEYMFPYPYEKDALAEKLRAFGLEQVLINLPAGNWEAGERGIALRPDRVGEFEDGVGLALSYAKTLGCTRVNCLVGLTPKDVPAKTVRQTLVRNLRFAAGGFAAEGIRFLVETINTRDMPGFYLSTTPAFLALTKEVDHPNVFYQYDVYHMQVMEGRLTETMRANIDRIGHIQVADEPGRHEPGTGEINYPNLFRFIEEAGYKGFIGCEYRPAGKTEDGLGWVKGYLGG